MIAEYLVASLRNLRAIFLEAGQDHEIALVDHLAAVTLNVAIACGLLFRRTGARRLHLSEGRSGGRQECDGQDKLAHEIFRFRRRENRERRYNASQRIRELRVAAYRGNESSTSLPNAAKLTTPQILP